MTVKKYLILSLVVILLTLPVSAASYNWDQALVFTDDDVIMTECSSDPWYPVFGNWYRIVSVNPNNGNVYIDVVVQCVDSELVDPVSGSMYSVIEPEDDDPMGCFCFPFLGDEDGFGSFPAYSAIFPAERPNPPADNAVTSGLYVVLSMIGSILDSMLSPSGSLFPLTVILCVGIAVSLLMLAIYSLHKWIWGL